MSFKLTCHCSETTEHAGKSIGSFQEFLGYKDVYITGSESSSKGVLLFLTDMFGNKYINNQLIADEFSKSGYYVLVPDLFDNDPVDFEVYKSGKAGYFEGWRAKHGFDVSGPFIKDLLTKIKSELNPKRIFAVGYCYGGKLVAQNLTQSGLLEAGAIAHPALPELEEYEAITKPVIYSCAENDMSFSDEKRHQVEQIMKKNGITYQFSLFSGTSHGFAVRGDPNNPSDKYAAEKTFQDQIIWFDRFNR